MGLVFFFPFTSPFRSKGIRDKNNHGLIFMIPVFILGFLPSISTPVESVFSRSTNIRFHRDVPPAGGTDPGPDNRVDPKAGQLFPALVRLRRPLSCGVDNSIGGSQQQNICLLAAFF